MKPSLKILLVDNPTEASSIRSLLDTVAEYHFAIDPCETMEDAPAKISTNQYDTIVTNVGFPDFEGSTAVAALRKIAPEIPLVVFCSDAERHLTKPAFALGADNVLIREVADGNRIALGILYAMQKRQEKRVNTTPSEEFLLGLQERILAKIDSKELSLRDALSEVVLALENFEGNKYLASVLLLKDNRLYLGAAPNLPTSYNNAIEGLAIGPKAGSCGTAAYCRQPVYAVDIERDHLWQDFREAARPHQLKACWSLPIIDTKDVLLGTFAMYYKERRFPTIDERNFIQAASKTVAAIIEKTRT